MPYDKNDDDDGEAGGAVIKGGAVGRHPDPVETSMTAGWAAEGAGWAAGEGTGTSGTASDR